MTPQSIDAISGAGQPAAPDVNILRLFREVSPNVFPLIALDAIEREQWSLASKCAEVGGLIPSTVAQRDLIVDALIKLGSNKRILSNPSWEADAVFDAAIVHLIDVHCGDKLDGKAINADEYIFDNLSAGRLLRTVFADLCYEGSNISVKRMMDLGFKPEDDEPLECVFYNKDFDTKIKIITAMSAAAMSGSVKMCKTLLDYGFNPWPSFIPPPMESKVSYPPKTHDSDGYIDSRSIEDGYIGACSIEAWDDLSKIKGRIVSMPSSENPILAACQGDRVSTLDFLINRKRVDGLPFRMHLSHIVRRCYISNSDDCLEYLTTKFRKKIIPYLGIKQGMDKGMLFAIKEARVTADFLLDLINVQVDNKVIKAAIRKARKNEIDRHTVGVGGKLLRTPLMASVARRNYEICKELLDRGADPLSQDFRGQNAFSLVKSDNEYYRDTFFKLLMNYVPPEKKHLVIDIPASKSDGNNIDDLLSSMHDLLSKEEPA